MKIKEEQILPWLWLSLPVIGIVSLHTKIMSRFNFEFTDMDQAMMLVGLAEFRKGNFHMPRYFGQDYGSMIEAWIATPFVGVDFEVLLPTISYTLLALPFLLVPFLVDKERRINALILSLSVLAAMPIEYLMIGAKPHDMTTGVAVASVSFLFLRRTQTWPSFFSAFFLVLGASVNSNAALLAVPVLGWLAFRSLSKPKSVMIYLGGGLLTALLIHFSVYGFYQLHQELVVHHSWQLKFEFDLLLKGLSRLDLHYGNLVPFFHFKGVVILLVGLSALAFSVYSKRWGVAIAATLMIFISVFSLGLNKVHDATTSVFFSYSRMFMALPAVLSFLVLQFKIPKNALAILAISSFVLATNLTPYLNSIIKRELNHENIFMVVSSVDGLREKCSYVEEAYASEEAEAIIYGPGKLDLFWLVDRACPCLTKIDIMVRPEYERKTWDMRTLDQAKYSQFLWFSPELSDSLLTSIGIKDFRKIKIIKSRDQAYLIKGENLNPIEIYKKAGFVVSNY